MLKEAWQIYHICKELPEGSFEKKESRNYRKIYAALMLIKDMCDKKLISDIVYKNILDDYSEELDLSDFMD